MATYQADNKQVVSDATDELRFAQGALSLGRTAPLGREMVQFALGSVHPTHLSEEWESSNATWNQKGHTGWSVLQACQTTGLPVTLAPVGIAQG